MVVGPLKKAGMWYNRVVKKRCEAFTREKPGALGTSSSPRSTAGPKKDRLSDKLERNAQHLADDRDSQEKRGFNLARLCERKV